MEHKSETGFSTVLHHRFDTCHIYPDPIGQFELVDLLSGSSEADPTDENTAMLPESVFNDQFRILNLRYLPDMRPIYVKPLVQGISWNIPRKYGQTYGTNVQHLHFRILSHGQ